MVGNERMSLPGLIVNTLKSYNLSIKNEISEQLLNMLVYYHNQLVWRYKRLILIGNMKGSSDDGCQLSKLPRDIVKLLLFTLDTMIISDPDSFNIVSLKYGIKLDSLLDNISAIIHMDYSGINVSVHIDYNQHKRTNTLIPGLIWANTRTIIYRSRVDRDWFTRVEGECDQFILSDDEFEQLLIESFKSLNGYFIDPKIISETCHSKTINSLVGQYEADDYDILRVKEIFDDQRIDGYRYVYYVKNYNLSVSQDYCSRVYLKSNNYGKLGHHHKLIRKINERVKFAPETYINDGKKGILGSCNII